MKYLSFFTGIGGFEQAIHKVFPDAICVGYSEIKDHAMKVYQHHFPDHTNLGDITKIESEAIRKRVKEQGCDLIVGGFPCTNLTSIANLYSHLNNAGLEGPKSGLFYHLRRIYQAVHSVNPKVRFIFENNASMSLSNRVMITELLQEVGEDKVYVNPLNASLFGVQTRNRLFWTNFLVEKPGEDCSMQTWEDVLEPVDDVYRLCLKPRGIEYYNRCLKRKAAQPLVNAVIADGKKGTYSFTLVPNEEGRKARWQIYMHSDTTSTAHEFYSYPVGHSRPILAGRANVLIDRRVSKDESTFLIRKFSNLEEERLFGLADGYTSVLRSETQRRDLLGNCVSVLVVTHIVKALAQQEKSESKDEESEK